jgi:hypothetical protein
VIQLTFDQENITEKTSEKLTARRLRDRRRYANNPKRRSQCIERANARMKKPEVVAKRKREYACKVLLFVSGLELKAIRSDLTDPKTRGTCRICGIYARRLRTGIKEFGAIQSTHLKQHRYLWNLKKRALLPQSFPLGVSEGELQIETLDAYIAYFGFTKSNSLISPTVKSKMRANYDRRGGDKLAARARAHQISPPNISNKGMKLSKEMRQKRSKYMNAKIREFLFGSRGGSAKILKNDSANRKTRPPKTGGKRGPNRSPVQEYAWYRVGRRVEEKIPIGSDSEEALIAARKTVSNDTRYPYDTVARYHKKYRQHVEASPSE